MLFEWMADPAAWAGLATLIVLEVVLGIDNLVFIAILADKLPEHQRDRARLIGLSLALVMRLALLASIAWIVTLTQPLFSILGFAFSGRSLILIFGGLFLLFKGTMELHERLEGHSAGKGGKVAHAVFWQVLVQIVLLDAVFSLDSVITAVGMVDELSVMMIAVIVAIGVMMLSSGPLMRFVSSHPTVVILCLGFLLMIGFSLIVEGFGFHIPKGYLYAAITFSIIIEAFNQIGRRNRVLIVTSGDLRDRTADAILRLLGSPRDEMTLGGTGDVLADKTREERVFAPEEKDMIQGVLTLAERPVKSIMTPRTSIDFLDLDDAPELLRQKILDGAHTRFPIARGELDNFLGVALAKDMLRDILEEGEINPERSLRQPLVIHESTNVLGLMAKLRKSPLQMAIVMDEYGSVEGIATPIDVLEAIAGEFPDEDEDAMTLEQREDGVWVADGGIDIRRASTHIGADLVDDSDRYSTLAGYLLWHLGDLPREGQSVVIGPLAFEVLSMKGRHINKILIRRQD